MSVEERTAAIMQMRDRGLSFGQIAKNLGASKGAVCGAAFRAQQPAAEAASHKSPWTLEADDTIRKMHAERARIGAVAVALGRTPLAVSWRARQLGLSFQFNRPVDQPRPRSHSRKDQLRPQNRNRKDKPVRTVDARTTAQRSADVGLAARLKAARNKLARKQSPNVTISADLPADAKPGPIWKMGSRQCRWMGGGPTEHTCCGAPTSDGESWCAHHRELVWA